MKDIHQSMDRSKLWLTIFTLVPAVTLLLFLANISLGSVHIPLPEIITVILGGEAGHQSWHRIIIEFRLPKAITALLAGAGLAISGLQMQTLFRNPLAGPFVLGISSGASLGVALMVLASFTFGGIFSYFGIFGNWLVVVAAAMGAGLVLFLVVLVSVRIKDSMTLLIIGLMFGAATGAMVSVLQYFANKDQIQAFLIWTFGSLGGLTWRELQVFMPVTLLGLIIAFILSKPLNALLLGENYAQSMGLNIQRARLWIIISTSLLAGGITAFCGPIAFIGIAVPHLTRMLIDTSDHKLLIPAVCFSGAILMLICDIISQMPGSAQTIPINAVTSLFGAPVVIWIILRKRNIRSSFAG